MALVVTRSVLIGFTVNISGLECVDIEHQHNKNYSGIYIRTQT